jgi:hypothetical protein
MNKKTLIVKRIPLYGILFFLIACTTNSFDKQKLEEKIRLQEDCWNNQDIECFMQTYWKSDSLKFIGKNGLQMGWDRTLNNYKKSYPSKELMGKLRFDIKIVEPLNEESAMMIGNWNLFREKDTLSGYSTIIWKKINDEWVIIADHSS